MVAIPLHQVLAHLKMSKLSTSNLKRTSSHSMPSAMRCVLTQQECAVGLKKELYVPTLPRLQVNVLATILGATALSKFGRALDWRTSPNQAMHGNKSFLILRGVAI